MAITYLNSYVQPTRPVYPDDIHLHTPADEYDFNFALKAQPIKVLEGEARLVRLEPFVPSFHAQELFDASHKFPELFAWMPIKMWNTLAELLDWAERWIRTNPANMCYVIYDTNSDGPNEGRLAGMISLINSFPADLITEMGWVTVLPHAQRSHILTHTVSLLLDHCFNLPADGGLGVRRVEWRANCLNIPSVNAAVRLGLTNETPNSLRGHRVLLPGQVGSLPGRVGDAAEGRSSRSSSVLGITYEDWFEGGKKERLQGMLVRK